MPTIVKRLAASERPSSRKTFFAAIIKTFRLKKDAEDRARRPADEVLRGLFVQRAPAER